MKHWSQEDTEKFKAAHADCMALMGIYADPDVLNIAMQGDIELSPDEAISIMYNSAWKYLEFNLLTQEAKHKTTEGPHGLLIHCHYVIKKNWYKYDCDIPEHNYQRLDLEYVKCFADNVFQEARKDADNAKKNNANKRKHITWDYVRTAVDKVNKKILDNPKEYTGQGYDLTFKMIVNELIKIVNTSESGFYRWLRDTDRTKKSTYELLSSEVRKIIKNIK